MIPSGPEGLSDESAKFELAQETLNPEDPPDQVDPIDPQTSHVSEIISNSSNSGSFFRTPLNSSLNSAKSGVSNFSTPSTGSFTRLRSLERRKSQNSKSSVEYERKRMDKGPNTYKKLYFISKNTKRNAFEDYIILY